MGENDEGGDTVVLGDTAVEATEEVVLTIDESVKAPVVTPDLAAEALLAAFGRIVDADYLEGKTRFRDVLCDRFDLSQVEAEEIVDILETSGRVRFVETAEGVGFRIERDPAL